jgi:uncharacterized membrane protein YcaP (DUF421 family)
MEQLLKVFTEQGDKLNEWQMLLRGLLILLSTIIIMRLGKRKFFGRNSAVDIIFAVMIGSVASRAINGSGYLLSTVLIIALLVFFHALLSYLTLKYHKIAILLEGSGIRIISGGKMDEEMIKNEFLRKEEILESARLEAHIEDISEIDNAYLEANGKISIIPKNKN